MQLTVRAEQPVHQLSKGGITINKPKSITKKKSRKLLARLDDRDRLLVELMIKSGLRIGDALKITAGQINKKMRVYESKSKRCRDFKIGKKLYSRLKILAEGKEINELVFHSERKQGVSVHRSTIHRRIKKALKTLKFDASAHSARKLYAQNVYSKTKSVKKVQKAMNHHRITTTAAYLDIDVDKIISKGVRT